MRILFILLFIGNIALTFSSLAVLPERVAIHFGTNGMANGWGSNHVYALIMMSVHLVLFCLLYFAPRIVMMVPPGLVSMPNKQYWLAPENRARTLDMLQRLLWHMGLVLFAFLLVVDSLVLKANKETPPQLNTHAFLPVLCVLFIYLPCWIIAFFRTFRLPRR